jgi:hypothetical protein
MAFATIGNSALTGSIDLTSKVTGTLPTANGGTGTTSYTAGVTEADQWRVTSNFTGDANPVASNWERNDFNFDKIGTGMTESSGIFTFPSTGIWEIKYEGVSQIGGNAQNRWNDWKIEATTNDSSYSLISGTGNSGALSNTANSQYSSAQSSVIFDVTNVSTHKVRFSIDVNDGSTSQMGASGYQYHGATFIRLGDT